MIWTVIGHYVRNSRPEHSGQPFLDTKYSRGAFGQALLVIIFIMSSWQMVGPPSISMFNCVCTNSILSYHTLGFLGYPSWVDSFSSSCPQCRPFSSNGCPSHTSPRPTLLSPSLHLRQVQSCFFSQGFCQARNQSLYTVSTLCYRFCSFLLVGSAWHSP